jgi:hypothetical protein
MSKIMVRAVAGLVVLALAWLAWPLWSGYHLRQAIRNRDGATLEARVDFPTLRANLRPKLLAAVREDAQQSSGIAGILKRALGEAVTARGIDFLVTPANLSRLLAGRDFVARNFGGAAPPPAPPPARRPPGGDANDPATDDPEELDDPMPPRRLRYAFFDGSPTRFRFETAHPRFPGQRVVAHLAWQGVTWRLVDISLTPGR